MLLHSSGGSGPDEGTKAGEDGKISSPANTFYAISVIPPFHFIYLHLLTVTGSSAASYLLAVDCTLL